MTQFNWDDMQFFLALARDGQLTGAARALGSSHVTVARRVDRLEASLRQRLFERSAKGYELTLSGRRLVAVAERMEAASEAVDLGVAPEHSLTGSLRVAVPEGVSIFFTEHLLAPFVAQFSGLALELVALTQVLSPSRRAADMSVTLDPIQRGGYRSELLAPYHLRLYGARSYLAAQPEILARDDLLAHRFIGYIEEMLFAPALDYLGEIHPALRATIKSSSIFNQLQAARQGLGLCVLPCYLADPCADLVAVLPEEITLTRRYWLSVHQDTRQMRRERLVARHLLEGFAQAAPKLLARPL